MNPKYIPLLIQVALGVLASDHKITDGVALSTLFEAGHSLLVVVDLTRWRWRWRFQINFSLPSSLYMPMPSNRLNSVPRQMLTPDQNRFTKSYVFDASKPVTLKLKVGSCSRRPSENLAKVMERI